MAFENTEFSVPENFDTIKEYNGGYLKLHTGGNDWETSYTCFMLMRRPDYSGDSERIWVTLNPPDGMDDFGYVTDDERERGITEDDKRKAAEKQGKAFVKAWEDAARDMRGQNGERKLPDSLNMWADALKESEELKPMIEGWGKDHTKWVGKKMGSTWLDRFRMS